MARRHLGWTQAEMAERLGLPLVDVQAIESGRAALMRLHVLALERVALTAGAERGNIKLVPESVRQDLETLGY